MSKSVVYVLLLTLITFHGFGQTPKDQNGNSNYLEQANTYRLSDPDKSLKYGLKALKRAEAKVDKEQICLALNITGFLHLMQGEHELALSQFERSLSISKELGNKKLTSIAQNNLGNYYNYRGYKDKALAHYLTSLKIKEKLKDKKAISVNLINIAMIYDEQGKSKQALEKYKRALTIKEELKDQKGIAIINSNIGALFAEKKEFKLAGEYLDRALSIYHLLNDKRGVQSCQLNQSEIYYEQGLNDQSSELLQSIVDSSEQRTDVIILSDAHHLFAKILFEKSQFNQALDHAKLSVNYAISSGDLETEKGAYELLSKTYEAAGYSKEALEAYRASKAIKDSIQSVQTTKYIEKLQVEYETEIKDKKLQLQDQDIQLLNKDRKIKIYAIVGLILFALIISVIFYARYKKQQIKLRQKEAERKLAKTKNEFLKKEMEIKNKEILSFTLETAQKNEMILKLKEDVLSCISTIENDGNFYEKKVNGIFRNVETTEADWNSFKHRFEQLEQGFLHKLQSEFSALTPTDIRICALIRLRVSTREMAAMLNVAHESVHTSRYRIRKKMGLEKGQELDAFISAYQ